MLTRSCCCGGCFDIDDCPLAYGSLGDFTYTTTIDIGQVAGTFANYAYTALTDNPTIETSACYAFGNQRDKCCVTGPSCTAPTDTLVDKYFDVMALTSINVERTYFSCFYVVRRPESLPRIVKTVRCGIPKTVTNVACNDTYPVQCSDLFPDCYQGPSPNYLTQLYSYESSYALRLSDSQLCGDLNYVIEDKYEFDPLVKGGGDVRMRRNGQTTFTVDQTSGTGLSNLTYLHRTNICPGGTTSECGPCTLSGIGGTPCAAGRCCCRSYLDVSIAIRRPYRLISYVWSAPANGFVQSVGPTLYEDQTLRLIYEGPVDERLYRTTGSATQRTFTLLTGSITGTFALDAPNGFDVTTLNYCPFDVNGLPGQLSGSTTTTTVNTTTINDECQPCLVVAGPTPDWLPLEALEAHGILRTIIVTRTTP